VIGVDEHAWRHTRRGDKYVTVVIDLTRVRAGTGPARLLDMVEGRSKQAFKQSSATSQTTLPDPYSRPAASDPDYTLHCEEPDKPLHGRTGEAVTIDLLGAQHRHLERREVEKVLARVLSRKHPATVGPSSPR
jgi:hypothetical protein